MPRNDTPYEITIRNWHAYQREMRGGEKRRRRREWIAISVDLFSDPDFLELDHVHARLWLGLLLHSGKVGPVFSMTPARAVSMFCLKRPCDFQNLANQGFIDLKAATNKTYKTRGTGHDITPAKPAKRKTKKRAEVIHANTIDLEELKAIYPKRSGNQPWPRAVKAINARIKEGHKWDEIADGIRRYSAYCKEVGKIGTEFVMMASTFCGPDKNFQQDWIVPANKGQQRDDENVDKLSEWATHEQQQ